MDRIHLCTWWLVLSLILSGCSVELNQSPVTGSPIANPQNANGNPAPAKIPVTWENLNLTGKLVYIAANIETARASIRSLDLETGDVATIFEVPPHGWTDAIAVSPDYQTLILAYSPPIEAPYGGQRSLYRMPLDGSEAPQLLFTPPSTVDEYFQPEWSPDGKYVYFTHINNQAYLTDIWRMPYPDGNLQKLADQASWPRVSGDVTRMTYVWINSETGVNRLVLANADGTDAMKVRLKGVSITIVDTPMFSADNQSIIFSAPVGLKVSAPNWIDKLFGVQVALANGSLVSDWWSVPVTGGKVNRLTNILSSSLFGTFSPDHKHIASYSTSGIFVMKPDGSEVTMIVDDVGGIRGTVDWIP